MVNFTHITETHTAPNKLDLATTMNEFQIISPLHASPPLPSLHRNHYV